MVKVNSIFREDIKRDINSVVKVQDSNKEHIRQELREYVITEQLRNHFNKAFKNYLNGNKYGFWISGWFGSGKSHFTKLFGHVLSNQQFENSTSSEEFLIKDVTNELKPVVEEIQAKYDTEILMFDILEDTGYDNEGKQASITLTIYKQFLSMLGYYNDVVWVGELELDLFEQGLFEVFKSKIKENTGKEWFDIRTKAHRNKGKISKALVEVDSEDFPTENIAKDAIDSLQRDFSISPKKLVNIMSRYVRNRNLKNNKEPRLFLLIDEMGQFISGDKEKINELQGIAHQIETTGKGTIWLGVTSQEELKGVVEDVIKVQDQIDKIADRFDTKIHLTPENLDDVLYERILKKKLEVIPELEEKYKGMSAKLETVLSFSNTNRTLPKLNKETFVLAYPFFPYQLGIIKDIFVRFLQQKEINKKLGGTNRSMIKTTQGILLNKENNFDTAELGTLVTFDQVYAEAVAANFVPSSVIDTVNEVNSADPENSKFTKRVIKVLFLIDYINYIPKTVENISRFLFSNIYEEFHELVPLVESSLKKLDNAGFIQRQGEEFLFLSPEEQNFRHEVLNAEIEVRTPVVSRHIKQILKGIFNQNRVFYKKIRTFDVDIVIDEEKIKTGNEIAIEIISSTAFANDENIISKKLTKSINNERVIYWFAKGNEEIEGDVRRYIATENTIEEQRKRADDERQLFLRNEEKKNQELADHIIRKIKVDLSNGTYMYRGKEYDLPTGEVDIKVIFDTLVDVVIPEVYTRFEDIGVKIDQSNIQEVFKEKLHSVSSVFKELNLLDSEYQANPSSKVLNEILNEIRVFNNRNGVCTGKDILEYFGGNQFGWDTLTIRFLTAILFRGGFIELDVKGKLITTYTDPGVKEKFEKEPQFKECQFNEVKNIDAATRQSCKRILQSEFDIAVSIDTVQELYKKVTDAANQVLRNIIGLTVIAKQHHLTIIGDLIKVEEAFQSVIQQYHSTDTVITFVEKFRLVESELSLASKFDRFQQHGNIEQLAELNKFVREIWLGQEFEKEEQSIEKAETILKELTSKSFLDNWISIQTDFQFLKNEYLSLFTTLHTRVMQKIEKELDEIEGMQWFEKLEHHTARYVLEPLSKHYQTNIEQEKRNYEYLVQLENALESHKRTVLERYVEAVTELNKPTDNGETGGTIVPKPLFKQVKISGLMSTKQISTEKELRNYLNELEYKLREELKKVDYFFLS